MELRDAYKRLQRALARARAGKNPARPSSSQDPTTPSGKKKAASSTTGSRVGTPSARRRSSTTLEPEPGFGIHDEEDERPDDPVPQEDEELGPPVADERTTGTHSRRGNETWSAEEWEAWYRGWWQEDRSPRRYRRGRDDEDEEDDPPLPDPEWDKYELEEIEVLPPEILGWMLLRRSGLPGQARLSVLAATNNSLDFEVVEKAMRDQEEELLSAERHRDSRDHRGRRSYWVEDSGEWGLMLAAARPSRSGG